MKPHLNPTKYGEGWNNGKDIMPEDFMVSDPDKDGGRHIIMQIGPLEIYYQGQKRLEARDKQKFYNMTIAPNSNDEEIKQCKIDFIEMLIEHLKRVKANI